jgi:hypothetical protein
MEGECAQAEINGRKVARPRDQIRRISERVRIFDYAGPVSDSKQEGAGGR